MCGYILAVASAVVFAAPLAAQFPEVTPVPQRPAARLVPVYRLLAAGANDHLYTFDRNEVATLTGQGSHTYEGVGFLGFSGPAPGTQPLYRFSTANGTHLLDTRRQAAADRFARPEGVVCYIATEPHPGLVPLYAWINPQHGLGFYTTDPRGEAAVQNGYRPAGILGYVAPGQF